MKKIEIMVKELMEKGADTPARLVVFTHTGEAMFTPGIEVYKGTAAGLEEKLPELPTAAYRNLKMFRDEGFMKIEADVYNK